jgi:hypothetical protein
MATAHEPDLQAEVLQLFRELEGSVLEAGRKWAKAVGDAKPVDMPFVRELLTGAFDFGEEVLKSQREFAQGMLKLARQSATPTHRTSSSGPAHRTTPKTKPTTKAA